MQKECGHWLNLASTGNINKFTQFFRCTLAKSKTNLVILLLLKFSRWKSPLIKYDIKLDMGFKSAVALIMNLTTYILYFRITTLCSALKFPVDSICQQLKHNITAKCDGLIDHPHDFLVELQLDNGRYQCECITFLSLYAI